MSVYKYYKDLPPWAKGIVIVGTVGVTVYVGFKVYKGVKKSVDLSKEKQTVKDAQKDLATLISSGQKPSYTDTQYSAWADKIVTAFAGCDYSVGVQGLNMSGSANALMDIVMKLKNDADFLKLVSAYSVRTYDQCGTWPFSGDFTGSLNQAVADELADFEIVSINKALAKNGITYKF